MEVSPPFDTAAEVTCIAATNLLLDIMALMVQYKRGRRISMLGTNCNVDIVNQTLLVPEGILLR